VRQPVRIVEVRIDETVADKIRTKHNMTPEEVREALVLRPDVDRRWENHPEHGRRLLAEGTTYEGRPVLAALLPVDVDDGIWMLKTARSPKT
jgi:hypothetical protein